VIIKLDQLFTGPTAGELLFYVLGCGDHCKLCCSLSSVGDVDQTKLNDKQTYRITI